MKARGVKFISPEKKRSEEEAVEEVLEEEKEVLEEEVLKEMEEEVLDEKVVDEEYSMREKLTSYDRDRSKEGNSSFKMLISNATSSRIISSSKIPYSSYEVHEKPMWTSQPRTTCSRMIPVGNLWLRNLKFGRKTQSPGKDRFPDDERDLAILKRARLEDAPKNTGAAVLHEKTPPVMFADQIMEGVASLEGVVINGICASSPSSHLAGSNKLNFAPRTSISIVSNSLTNSSIKPVSSACTSISPLTPLPSSCVLMNPVTTLPSTCVASPANYPSPYSSSELMAKNGEIETRVNISSSDERFNFGGKLVTMSSWLQRELHSVGGPRRTVELLPIKRSAIQCSNPKTHSSPSAYVSSDSSLPHAAVGANSGVQDHTCIRRDRSSLSVGKSHTYVHKKGRTLPLTIFGKRHSPQSHSSSWEQKAGLLSFSNSVASFSSGSLSVGATPVLRARRCSCESNVATEENCDQFLRVVLPNLDVCCDQVLCYTQQQKQDQQQQQLCVCVWVEKCALCTSGLESLCSKLHPYVDCRCNGCLSGIRHLF